MITLITLFLTIITILSYILKAFSIIFAYNWIAFKLFILFIVTFLIRKIYLYPYQQRLKLSYLRKVKYESHLKYKINDHNDLDISITILLLYVMFFIILLFVSRINNSSKIIDFNSFLNFFYIYLSNTSYFSLLLNFSLIISFIILYLLLLQLFFKFIKFHFMRLFFFSLLSFIDTLENPIITLRLSLRFNRFTRKFIDKFLFKNKKYHNIHLFLDYHIIGLEFIIHRLILFLIIIYDLKYNNMILTHMYKAMPYIFVYDLWINFYLFLIRHNFDFDKIISRLLYQEITIIEYDTECLYLNGEPFERKLITEILLKYIPQGFIDNHFIIDDPIYNLKELLHYYKDFIITPLLKKMALIAKIDLVFLILILIFLLLT